MLRRVLVVLAVAGGLAGVLTAVPTAANAAPAANGAVRSAIQDTFAHRLTVRGWADDPARPNASIMVTVRVDGRVAGQLRADSRSRNLNASHGFAGRHDFTLHTRWTRRAHVITLSTHGRHSSGPRTRLGHLRVRHVQPSPGKRIISLAKPFVGKARYRDGGASPRTGFDCSGYTKWVFAHAHVASLPHNAEAQRHAHGMRQISVRHARPGDLVFYMSGSSAYHVAIYAGHHMQYAAATPRDGIRYQAVWSRAVQYRTDWH
jgi:cell wall-associated NlpC family hydrolase